MPFAQAPLLSAPASDRPASLSELVDAHAGTETQSEDQECIAAAVYFEARSESELGQLAVAKVVLNRVKDPNFPKTICGVVYQGSDRRNSCQFSFACDGIADEVRGKAAWDQSKRIAQKAIAGDQTIRVGGVHKGRCHRHVGAGPGQRALRRAQVARPVVDQRDGLRHGAGR